MRTFLKTTVDDASVDQRAEILLIYILLFAANGLVWTWAIISLSDRPGIERNSRK